VLTGEYDVADGNLTGAQSMLETMAGAANVGDQIPEQVWSGSTGTGGFTFGQPDNSSTPLMWAMAQFVRLAIDISAGKDVDTPSVVTQCAQQGSCPVTGSVKETANATVANWGGGSWNNVEESSSCGFIANHTFGFDTADASCTANDTVAAREGVGSC
jgi:hypothetical protein